MPATTKTFFGGDLQKHLNASNMEVEILRTPTCRLETLYHKTIGLLFCLQTPADSPPPVRVGASFHSVVDL